MEVMALRSVGLEGEARECEMAETAPHDAACAAHRAEMDILCITSERNVQDFEAVAQIVAINAAHSYWRAVAETDLLVPVAADHAAIATIGWEIPSALSAVSDADLRWVWDCTAVAVEDILKSVPVIDFA